MLIRGRLMWLQSLSIDDPGLCREQPSAETVVNNAFSLFWLASAGSGDKWTTRQNEKMTNKKENTTGVAFNFMQHEGTGGVCGRLRCEAADWRPARFDPPQSQQPLRVGDKVALVSKLHFFFFWRGVKQQFVELRVFTQAKCWKRPCVNVRKRPRAHSQSAM